MFGFGLGKLLLLALIAMAVWYGFKKFSRPSGGRPRDVARKTKQPIDSIDQTEKCPVCGTYVVAGHAAPCGRQGCPY